MLKTKLELPCAIRWFQFYSQCNERHNSFIQYERNGFWFSHYVMFHSIFEAVCQNFFSISLTVPRPLIIYRDLSLIG